jgi:beta-lactamase superfamily II metal-dependent hydrolase
VYSEPVMDFEIEFFPVGDSSKAGDAIVARYGNGGAYAVTVIDGGTEDTGSAIVEHIKTTYGPATIVDDLISTHPDSDHASGLRKVLAELPVRRLWLHGIWHHSDEVLPFFEDKRWTRQGLETAIRKEYPMVAELIELAEKQKTPVLEPFAGHQIGPFTVLSPTKWAYVRLIPQFRRTPLPDVNRLKAERMWIEQPTAPSFFGALIEKAISWIPEIWEIELLKEGAVTAAENETSTVLYGRFGSLSILLTADAGVNALLWAANFAQQNGIDLATLNLVQVPHHGSRSNVTPSVLDRLLGPKLPRGAAEKRYAIVSCPKDDENHPRKMVMNAFMRRGAGVRKTQGARYRYHSGTMPHRPDEVLAMPFGFFDRVEAYD